MHPTGETSARLMIAAIALSPLRSMFPGSNALRWLMNRRRYLGLGAFAYAALHTIFYLVDMASIRAILGKFLPWESGPAGLPSWLFFRLH